MNGISAAASRDCGGGGHGWRARMRGRLGRRRPPALQFARRRSRYGSRTCRSPSPTATTRRCSPRRKTVAKENGATITVFDANNDPKKQFSQLQTAATLGQLRRDHRPADLRHRSDHRRAGRRSRTAIKVVNMDQILGTNLRPTSRRSTGLSGNVVFVPTRDRHEARPARRRRPAQAKSQPVQRRLPVRHQGVGARRRDPRRPSTRRSPGTARSRSSPRARASSRRRTASRPRRTCSRRTPT